MNVLKNAINVVPKSLIFSAKGSRKAFSIINPTQQKVEFKVESSDPDTFVPEPAVGSLEANSYKDVFVKAKCTGNFINSSANLTVVIGATTLETGEVSAEREEGLIKATAQFSIAVKLCKDATDSSPERDSQPVNNSATDSDDADGSPDEDDLYC